MIDTTAVCLPREFSHWEVLVRHIQCGEESYVLRFDGGGEDDFVSREDLLSEIESIAAAYEGSSQYGERVSAEFSVQLDRLFSEGTPFEAEVVMPAE